MGRPGATSLEDSIAKGWPPGPRAVILLGWKDLHLHGVEEEITITCLK